MLHFTRVVKVNNKKGPYKPVSTWFLECSAILAKYENVEEMFVAKSVRLVSVTA
jgi:hypothetical protein